LFLLGLDVRKVDKKLQQLNSPTFIIPPWNFLTSGMLEIPNLLPTGLTSQKQMEAILLLAAVKLFV
jgi:hypothetical protein